MSEWFIDDYICLFIDHLPQLFTLVFSLFVFLSINTSPTYLLTSPITYLHAPPPPPPHPTQVRYAGMTGAQIERARAKERGQGQTGLVGHASLTDEHHYEFLDMLQALTVSRRHIKQAMGFAFDHIDCAKDICHMLRRALMAAEAPVAAKVSKRQTQDTWCLIIVIVPTCSLTTTPSVTCRSGQGKRHLSDRNNTLLAHHLITPSYIKSLRISISICLPIACLPIVCFDQVARLYLLSDLLHNSSGAVKHAAVYRTLLQVGTSSMDTSVPSLSLLTYRSISVTSTTPY